MRPPLLRQLEDGALRTLVEQVQSHAQATGMGAAFAAMAGALCERLPTYIASAGLPQALQDLREIVAAKAKAEAENAVTAVGRRVLSLVAVRDVRPTCARRARRGGRAGARPTCATCAGVRDVRPRMLLKLGI